MALEERLRLVVDEAHSGFNHAKPLGLGYATRPRICAGSISWTSVVWTGSDRPARQVFVHQPAAERRFQGFTGSRKSYVGCALAKQACHQIRAHYIRMPDFRKPGRWLRTSLWGPKFLKNYAAFTLLVIDEWLLDHPDEGMRSILLELHERRYDTASTVFCTQHAKRDWHHRLGSGVHADAIEDRIVYNTDWVDTSNHNMRVRAP
ncbi:MAG: ATP-binding protein [Pseudarthrobacter sp.]|nr:ATP-binding protein [Pseudarthrobacter sp.]